MWLLRNDLVESIEVIELGDVGVYAGAVGAGFLKGLVELGLAAAGDEEIGAFLSKPLGGRDADAAVVPGYDGDLVFP